MPKKHTQKIAVIGLGYVGLPLALLSDKKGYQVFGVDIDDKKIKLLRSKISPFEDKSISRSLKSNTITFTSDFSVCAQADIVIICVPTPVFENRLPNYGLVKSAVLSIAPHIKKGALIILESTVNPGVCNELVLPLLEKSSGKTSGREFFLAHCPERINPGDSKWNVANISRVVGGLTPKCLSLALTFYKSIIDAEVKPMGSLKEAEAVKVVENSFRNVNIAFVNELAQSFSKLGIDVVNVIEGAATKPFAFMAHYPGCGVGGHCIPVDPYYLIDYAKKNGYKHEFLSLACKVNEGMLSYTVGRVVSALKSKGIKVAGTRVVVLGLAYKGGIDDCRESPAFEIVRELKAHRFQVVTYDPYVSISSAKTLKTALKNAKAVVIATDHPEFKSLTPKILKPLGVKVVVDGRNCLSKEKFTTKDMLYLGIGR